MVKLLHVQVFDGDMAYLHQTGVITKNHNASLDSWARDYFLASEADRYIITIKSNYLAASLHFLFTRQLLL